MISRTKKVAIIVCSLFGLSLSIFVGWGLMRGLQTVRATILEELTETALAVHDLNQAMIATQLVDASKEIKPLPIEKLTLPVNVLKALKSRGIDTIGQLMSMTSEELSQIPNIDRASAGVIATEIQRFSGQAVERDGAKDAAKAPAIGPVP
jgi:DNA-directed RNA polymerase alpha subunit